MRFGREKWIEDAFNVLRIDTGSRVLYGDEYTLGIVHLRAHLQHSHAIIHRTHGFGSIHDQVEDHLLYLDWFSRSFKPS